MERSNRIWILLVVLAGTSVWIGWRLRSVERMDEERGGGGQVQIDDRTSFPSRKQAPPVRQSARRSSISVVSPPVSIRLHPDEEVPVLTMPAFDVEAALADARKRDGQRMPYRFAKALPVSGVTPGTAGNWRSLSHETQEWVLEVISEGAQSLNLAFDDFFLPHGAELTIYPSGRLDQAISFSSKDNDAHRQLWTPVFWGDRVTMQLRISEVLKPQLRLAMKSVQHGFRSMKRGTLKIGGDTSGSCNVDVVCGEGDVAFGSLIDARRDQIQAVGAYTLNGVDTCSGTLVNNTMLDRKPYFLTADHCGINAANAPSMVCYWNFQNSTCRQPDTAASGGVGDGPLTTFNSGAIFRAASAATDFCLVELDDPVDANAGAVFAGWDRSGSAVASTFGIHHPAVAEKRISFDLDAPQITSNGGSVSPGNGNFWRVTDWDYGTTEGGSSGSALFDQNGRLIGQLYGGGAACGNNASDWYGRFAVSWNGAGTAATRLRDWLDPADFGLTTLDAFGKEQTLDVNSVSINEGDSGSAEVFFTLTVSPVPTNQVSVTAYTQSGTATAGSDYLHVSTNVVFSMGVGTQQVAVTVFGDLLPEEHETFSLILSNEVNAVVPVGTSGLATILNDDFIVPVITSALLVTGSVGQALSYQITAAHSPTGFAISDAPDGMSVDPLSGIVDWVPMTTGNESFSVVAANAAGATTQTVALVVLANPLQDAIDLADTVFPASQPVAWFRQTGISHDGVDAAQSGSISDGANSVMSIQLTGPDLVQFWRKVSSEEGFDFLRVRVDGETVDVVSGEVDWTRVSVPVPAGVHTLTWSYEKDGSVSTGSDAAWVDEVVVASTVPFPVFVSSGNRVYYAGLPVEDALEVVNGPAVIEATGLPAGLTISTNGVLQGVLNESGSFGGTVTASNAFGVTSLSLNLTVVPVLNRNDALDVEPEVPIYGDLTDWVTQTAVTHDGVDAAASRTAPVDFGTYDMQIPFMGPGEVKFFWKVSSEAGFDVLQVLRNGDVQHSISGEVEWEQRSVSLPPGTQVVMWRYAKDESLAAGDDRGYVDELEVSGYAAWVMEQGLDLIRASFEQDPEGDGVPNLLEYARLGNALVDDGVGLEPLMRSGTNLVVEIPKRDDAGLRYYVEGAPSLTGPWSQAGLEVLEDSASHLRVRLNDLFLSPGFLRLRVDYTVP